MTPAKLLRRAGWPLLVAAAVLVALTPSLLAGHSLAWRDTARMYLPQWRFIGEALRHGSLPLWDPRNGTGGPLFAQLVHGVLHPPAALVALLAPGAGIDLLLVVDVLLAALGAYALARVLGAAPAAAAMAGIGYGCSGYVLGSLANLPYLAGAASLPWALAAAWRAGAGAPFGVVATALATAALLLSGDVDTAMVGGALGAALAVAAGSWRGLARWAGGASVAGLLAAIQLVPAMTFLERSTRALELSERIRRQWALSPWRLPELFAPGLFGGRPGSLIAPVFQALDGPGLFSIPFCSSVFLGAALLALFWAGARERPVRVLAVSVPVLLWLALGHHLGAEQLLHPLPIWGKLRYAEKLVGALTLCVAVVAAFGSARFAERVRPVPVLVALALALVAIPAAASGALLGALLPPQAIDAGRAQLAEGLAHLAVALAAVLACVLVARRAPRWLPHALAAAVALESLAASSFAMHGTPMPLPPGPALSADPPGPRVCTPTGARVELASRSAFDRVIAIETALGYPGMNSVTPVENVWTYEGQSRRFGLLFEPFVNECVPFRRFATTHVVIPAASPDPGARSAVAGGERVGANELVEAWAVPHRPWASFAASARAIPKQRDTLLATVENMKVGSAEVILETDGAPPLSPGRILSARRAGPERVEIDAEADGPALLVVNDAWWPGWEARIDEAPTPIVAADVLVRAVRFPAGRHRLTMTYEPPEVRTGGALTLAGLVALVAVALVEWRRWRASRARRGGDLGRAGEGAAVSPAQNG
jgi:hypothetical protein